MSVTDILAMRVDNPPWMKDAACRNADPDLFHPEETYSFSPETKKALLICRGCPVRTQCLLWALQTEDRFGILGGKTPRQRSLMRTRLS